MANTTPYSLDGTIKISFFNGAFRELEAMRNRLEGWQDKYATLMRLESTTAGVVGEIDIMLTVIDQLRTDQVADTIRRKSREANLLAEGFPKKQTAYEKMHKRHKAKRTK